MATYYSPKLVTSGLVCYLDAANPKSYVGSGTSWTDISNTGNNGTLTNGPVFGSAYAGGILLDGVNDYVPITLVSNTVRPTNATVHFAVKLPAYSGGQRCILSYRDGISGGQLYIGKASAGIFCYYNSWNNAGFTVGNIADNSIAVVTIALDATNTTVTTYVNGAVAGSGTRTGWISGSYNTSLSLGYDPGGTNEYCTGSMYFFAHYNRVLSNAEIVQNYNAAKTRFGL